MAIPEPTPLIPDRVEQSGRLLARSAFSLVFLAFLAVIITAPFLLSAPMREAVRLPLMIGFGIIALIPVGLAGWLLRRPMEALIPASERVVNLFSRRGVGFIAVLLLVEFNLIAYFFVIGIVPNLSALLFLLVCWSVLLGAVVMIANAPLIRDWLTKTRSVWVSLGLMLTVLASFGLLYLLTSLALNGSGLIGQLRGAADYRTLPFFGGVDNPEESRAYWTELGALRAQWLSYSYGRIQPHTGTYINVSANGLRQTANFVTAGEDAPEIFFFGGSTVWGDGARDDYTIPSQVARLLSEQGEAADVRNYGQVGYVSTQDLILFQRQLALGNVPDVAVFYQGFNDLGSVYISDGVMGLPQNEINRVQDFVMGRMVNDGQIVLRRPTMSLSDVDMSLVGIPDATPEQIADFFLQNMRLVRASAAEYGVRTLFVWQPMILHKASLTPEEQAFVELNETTWPGFDALYLEVDRIFRERTADMDDVLILSDLFADEPGYVFIDRVHITEDGNFAVAGAITPQVLALMSE